MVVAGSGPTEFQRIPLRPEAGRERVRHVNSKRDEQGSPEIPAVHAWVTVEVHQRCRNVYSGVVGAGEFSLRFNMK